MTQYFSLGPVVKPQDDEVTDQDDAVHLSVITQFTYPEDVVNLSG